MSFHRAHARRTWRKQCEDPLLDTNWMGPREYAWETAQQRPRPLERGHVTQYLPGYFDPVNIPRHEARAETGEELLALPWVGRWLNFPEFHQFSWSPSKTAGYPAYLMVELNGGYSWWVIAYLDTPELYGLPLWEPKEKP